MFLFNLQIWFSFLSIESSSFLSLFPLQVTLIILGLMLFAFATAITFMTIRQAQHTIAPYIDHAFKSEGQREKEEEFPLSLSTEGNQRQTDKLKPDQIREKRECSNWKPLYPAAGMANVKAKNQPGEPKKKSFSIKMIIKSYDTNFNVPRDTKNK